MLAVALWPGKAAAEVTVLRGAEALRFALEATASAQHPTVVHFFATWCGDCVREMPVLQKAIASVQAQGATVILISLDPLEGGRAKVERFLKRFRLDQPVYLLDAPDPEPVAALFHTAWDGALPATFVLMRGERTASFIGPLRNGDRLEAAVRQASGVTAPAGR
jgi:thiol-disulfide isomerase/thioredoxin